MNNKIFIEVLGLTLSYARFWKSNTPKYMVDVIFLFITHIKDSKNKLILKCNILYYMYLQTVWMSQICK